MGARDVPARPRPRQPSQEWSWGPASRRWYPPFRRFSDDFTAYPGPARCEPVPRGRRARVSAHIAEGGSESRAMIIRAFLCSTSQGAAGGSRMPTPVCSCGDMWRGSSCSVCPRGRRPLQAASSPVWVGHDAMMISFSITRISRSRNFALRASILAVSTRAHERGHKESNDLGLGQIALNLKILS